MKRIKKEDAIERIRQCDRGVLVTATEEQVPIIGDIEDPEDIEQQIRIERFDFGDKTVNLKDD